MKQSVHVVQKHGEENERHRFLDRLLPSPRPSPKDAEMGEEEARQAHRWIADVHRQKTGSHGYHESLNRCEPVLNLPKNQQVHGKMEHVDMEETVDDMVLQGKCRTETYMPGQQNDAENGDCSLQSKVRLTCYL